MNRKPNNSGDLFGTQIDIPGPATWISKPWRKFIAELLTCLMHPKIFVRLNAGSGTASVTKEALISMGPKGWTATIDLSSSAAGISSAVSQQFKPVSDGGDYYNCVTTDGVTDGATYIKVAKHQELRCSTGATTSKAIRGVTYTYSYTPIAGTTADGVNVIEYSRTVNGSDATSTTSRVTPCLNVGEIINAVPAAFAGPATLVGVAWLALADGRAWSDPN